MLHLRYNTPVTDYYTTLGVAKNASPDEIKKAYRKLASQHHPDKGGDTQQFQKIQEAYAVLGDAQRRQQYDNPGPRISINSGPVPPFDFDTIFDVFGQRFHSERRPVARLVLWLELADIVRGGNRVVSVTTPMGTANVEIQIPQAVTEGSMVRYQGLAPGGMDLVVEFRVRPGGRWQRHTDIDVVTDVTVTIWQLILGTDLDCEMLSGSVIKVKVPPRTQPGTVLRVRGHGLPLPQVPGRGDAFIRLQCKLPDKISPQLLEMIQRENEK